MSPPRQRGAPKPWDFEDDAGEPIALEREFDRWSLRDRFPLKPGQRQVEAPPERPLGMQYGEEAEPVGEQLGSHVVGLLASHVGETSRLEALKRCLRSVEAQTVRPHRFLVSTSAAPDLASAVAQAVQGSPCVDEHLASAGPGPLAQFEHYRRLRDVVAEREERLEEVWVFFSDDDDLWHPGRAGAFLAAAEAVRRRVQRRVQAVCSCVHLRPRPRPPGPGWPDPTTAADVTALLADLAQGPVEHGSEHVDLCVRFSTFSSFFEEHSLRVVRHSLADVRFGYFVLHHGEVPRRWGGEAEARGPLVTEEDVLDADRTLGPVKVFLPESELGGPNWMYYYSKLKDTGVQRDGTGAVVQVLRPDDEWYAADLLQRAAGGDGGAAPADCDAGGLADELVAACAAVRQRLDYGLLRLPRQRLVVLEREVFRIADAAAVSRLGLCLAAWRSRAGDVNWAAAVRQWTRAVAFLRCKALKFEVYLSDFCAFCGQEANLKCSQCQAAIYCSEHCQWSDWNKGHRRRCVLSASARAGSRVAQSLGGRDYERAD